MTVGRACVRANATDRERRSGGCLVLLRRSTREVQEAFASPAADNPHPTGITPVHDAERWMDDLSQERLVEFGHYPADVGVVVQGLDSLEDLFHQPLSDFRHALLRVPLLHLLEIAQGGFGKRDRNAGHIAS